jgi:prophage DNA circulation protein
LLSHVFCTQCADTSGLSRSPNAHRTCPACGASLHHPDDVVVASLNPSEDYKTSILSGLSPTIIMECASRGLAFHSYQTSQEIIYQQHLAKGLTEKYNTLSQQMDQLIHDANAQIKALQDKIQGQLPHSDHETTSLTVLSAMQEEHTVFEEKNHELSDAFKQKAYALQHTTKLYQALKAQVMASHVATLHRQVARYKGWKCKLQS